MTKVLLLSSINASIPREFGIEKRLKIHLGSAKPPHFAYVERSPIFVLFILCFHIILVWFSIATKKSAKLLYSHTRGIHVQQSLVSKITGKKRATKP